jgi:hypothetical protein
VVHTLRAYPNPFFCCGLSEQVLSDWLLWGPPGEEGGLLAAGAEELLASFLRDHPGFEGLRPLFTLDAVTAGLAGDRGRLTR